MAHRVYLNVCKFLKSFRKFGILRWNAVTKSSNHITEYDTTSLKGMGEKMVM